MRVLITWGSKRGGTEGIARSLGAALEHEGLEVVLRPAERAHGPAGFDAVIVGGSLYATRWHRSARRFVTRHTRALRRVPVWLFSSGPLDDSAAHRIIPPTRQVRGLMQRVGAQGHATFGGRLQPDAAGWMAHGMAKKLAGDWRDSEQIKGWAATIASDLPRATPAGASASGRDFASLLLYGALAWGVCATLMLGLLASSPAGAALLVHALAAPLILVVATRNYYQSERVVSPFWAALGLTLTVAVLDLVIVAGIAQQSLAMFRHPVGSWLPFVLIFCASWWTGEARRRRMVGGSAPPRALGS